MKIFLIALLCISAGFLFYWFQWRPSEIRKNCSSSIIEQSRKENWDAWKANNRYRACLVLEGMPPESIYVNTE